MKPYTQLTGDRGKATKLPQEATILFFSSLVECESRKREMEVERERVK